MVWSAPAYSIVEFASKVIVGVLVLSIAVTLLPLNPAVFECLKIPSDFTVNVPPDCILTDPVVVFVPTLLPTISML